MYDCDKDICAFHKDEVTLPQTEQDAMRQRRDANRRRLREGLKKAEKPAPDDFVKQGSYAMKTMLRHPQNDYDIDDGVYFKKADLVGERGAEMTSLQARQMVRDAVDDGSFKCAPEVRGNCVRIFYEKGYHVDMPVYRKVEENGATVYELAASSGWKRSDARDVTNWFDKARSNSSDGAQLRRLVREIKKFARSRNSWSGSILSGFGITVLVVECQRLNANREDRALYDTMKAIRDRLSHNLVVRHPVTPNDFITSGSDDTKARMLREKLNNALTWLEPLFDDDCTRSEALNCWDKVYNTTYFSERGEDEARAASYAAPVATSAALIGLESYANAAVSSSGGGRHA
ncbi:hypothetical protein FHS96_005133 [Sphingomonas zeicaulis]|uniref:cyclic GMP-AMP synthase DncV-like nucleotidyltransferase n=1 Tax=Sphingomonas zeicaulis TaxID=1632740 RepID=UPI003D1EFC46